MSLWDRVTTMMALAPWEHPPAPTVQTRSATTLEDFIARTTAARDRPYRHATVSDALSVPAIFRAVVFISNIVGSMSMRAFRNGVELEADDRPRLVVRPNPFTTPREFYRETAWSLATYGEAWWYVMARDADNKPSSMMPVHPREVRVELDPDDARYPIITWRNRTWSSSDLVQIKMTGETGALRGSGPLQWCGAAVSVAVESQEWAANFFAEDGGIPSVVIKAAMALEEDDASTLLDQWMNKPHNQPRIVDDSIESVTEFGVNTQSAQMLDARNFQNGDAARMFGIPGSLLEYSAPGSSLTYQNVSQEFDKLLRSCLNPDYLEPVEQVMSDQLPRNAISRFNTDGLLRADIKTLYDVAAIGLEKGIFSDQDEARSLVGLAPSVESASVPASPPQAVPTPAGVPLVRTAREVRCPTCGKLVIELATPPYRATCRGCKSVVSAA